MSSPPEPSVLDDSEVQRQLGEKDQLIRALTERLEEAAEQLDRVHRSGGDKGGGRYGGGGSSELASQQQSLIEQLTKSVELWEDVQPRDVFARIEERLDELRDMLEGGVVATSGESAPKKQDTLAGWEKMKADLLGGESDEPAPTASPPVTLSSPAAPATQEDESSSEESKDEPATVSTPASIVYEPSPQPLDEQELPAPVDFEIAQREDLEAAIESRDQYIGYLTRRLRSAESNAHQQINWEELNNAPDKLRESLQNLESELDDRLRIAEVDLSLERARLSRVETRIRAMQSQIEKKLQAAERQFQKDSDSAKTAKKKDQPKSWFGSRGK